MSDRVTEKLVEMPYSMAQVVGKRRMRELCTALLETSLATTRLIGDIMGGCIAQRCAVIDCLRCADTLREQLTWILANVGG